MANDRLSGPELESLDRGLADLIGKLEHQRRNLALGVTSPSGHLGCMKHVIARASSSYVARLEHLLTPITLTLDLKGRTETEKLRDDMKRLSERFARSEISSAEYTKRVKEMGDMENVISAMREKIIGVQGKIAEEIRKSEESAGDGEAGAAVAV
jgi:hypothetical protein